MNSTTEKYQLTFPFTEAVAAFCPSGEKLQSRIGAGWLYCEINCADGLVETV